MQPYFKDSHVTLYHADVLDGLRALPPDSVHCVVTSPPYWGLRNYGVDGQLGLEKTPDEYLARMTEVFREVRRVLRLDGTCWVNMGDSYAGNATGSQGNNLSTLGGGKATQIEAGKRPDKVSPGLKPKDLCMIPERLALALQADGWWVRSEIIWAKPNPMPESVTDRPTKAHEKIYLLTKAERYFYDAEAVKEKQSDEWLRRSERNAPRPAARLGGEEHKGEIVSKTYKADPTGRNLRTVWTMATQPYPEAHFATFPEALPERCILAGTSERGCCPDCGAPWVRVVEKGMTEHDGDSNTAYEKGSTANRLAKLRQAARERGEEYSNQKSTLGWRPSCSCNHTEAENVPCTVLDPFGGSGTTGAVAKRLNRRAILIELNEKYCGLITRRISPQGVLL